MFPPYEEVTRAAIGAGLCTAASAFTRDTFSLVEIVNIGLLNRRSTVTVGILGAGPGVGKAAHVGGVTRTGTRARTDGVGPLRHAIAPRAAVGIERTFTRADAPLACIAAGTRRRTLRIRAAVAIPGIRGVTGRPIGAGLAQRTVTTAIA
jgi:hypothetical protein